MSVQRRRQFVSFGLLAGAVVFGVVLAGSLDLTPAAEPEPQAIQVPTISEGSALPGFADLVDAVSPAVVAVDSVRIEDVRQRGFPVDPFEWFFGPPRQQDPRRERDQPQQQRRLPGGGSGFVIDASGLVITNHHVVDGANEVKVHLDSREYPAEIIGTDPATDLALLRIEADRRLPYLELGDSDSMRPGDWVVAIGSPLGILRDTVTVGVVSAKARTIGITSDPSLEAFIQTDAAINFGNSGGPLLNLRGEVVGINTAMNWGSDGIGFAIPSNTLNEILPQLTEHGRVERGYLGIYIEELNQASAEAFGLEESSGILVIDVDRGTPAARAGVRHGDIILSVDGRPVRNTRDLIGYVSRQGPGAEVELEILRDGERVETTVELGERRVADQTGRAPERSVQEEDAEWLGLRYQELTPALKRLHSLPEELEGVWIAGADVDSPLYDEGFGDRRIGSVITEVNGRPVTSVEQFEEIIRGLPSGSRVRLYVRRFAQGQEQTSSFVFPRAP